MTEEQEMTLKVFFDGIEAHIKELLTYMEEERLQSIDKEHITRFLNDIKYEATETRKDLNID